MSSPTEPMMPPSWSLQDLYRSGAEDPQLALDMENAPVLAGQFASIYRGFWAKSAHTQGEILKAIEDYQALQENLDRPLVFAMLHHSALTTDPARGKLLSQAREAHSRANRDLIFFELEWIQLPQVEADKILALKEIAKYRHWLSQRRVFRPHTLSEPEEKIAERKQLSGRSAFRRYFDETISGLRVAQGEGKEVSLQVALSMLYDPVRSVRQNAAQAITRTLKTREKDMGFVLNTLVLEHRDDCDMRSYQQPDDPRNLSNQVDSSLVRMVMEVVESRQDLVARYYKIKGRLLGIAHLEDHDRYAPLPGDAGTMNWAEARELVVNSYGAFHAEAGRIVSLFFENDWIDAQPRDGKRSGAFCASGLASQHPYSLMSFTGRMRDVSTLAHELGHGLHQYLARDRGHLQADAPLVLAETASVFGEMLVYRNILNRTTDKNQRILLMGGKIEDSFATIFRQIVLTRFEHEVHRLRKEDGELSLTTLAKVWMETNQKMFGDSLRLNEGYSNWWSYIGHFIHSPFYCYAYAFGELLVLALYAKYIEEGPAFPAKYMEFLAAGGSEKPSVLLEKMGLDWSKPEFWLKGLGVLENDVTTMEKLAGST